MKNSRIRKRGATWDHSPFPAFKMKDVDDRIVRVTDRVTDKVTDKVTEQERKLLMLLSEDPAYTMPALAEKMGVSRKTVAVYIKNLKEKNVIERVGSDRKGYWRIKD